TGSRRIGFYWDIRLQFGIAAPFLALLRRQCCHYQHKISHQDHQGQWIIIFYPNLSLADGSSRQTSHAPSYPIVQSSPHLTWGDYSHERLHTMTTYRQLSACHL